MQELNKRCTELKLSPCRGKGLTADILLARINAEEQKRGLPLTTIGKKTTAARKSGKKSSIDTKTRPEPQQPEPQQPEPKQPEPKQPEIKTTNTASLKKGVKAGKAKKSEKKEPEVQLTPPVVSQYEEEIKESNPDLYAVAKPLFDAGDYPAFVETDVDTSAKGRWKDSDVEKMMKDPWHRLHGEMLMMTLEGNEDEATIFGEITADNSWSLDRLDAKGRDWARSLLGKYGLLFWLIWRSDRRMIRLKHFFILGGRLDLLEPLNMQQSYIDALSDVKTAKELYERFPEFKSSVHGIGPVYWKIVSKSPNPVENIGPVQYHNTRFQDLYIDLLDLGMVPPSPSLLMYAMDAPKLFERLIDEPKASLSGSDLKRFLRSVYYLSRRKPAIQLVKKFKLGSTPEAQQLKDAIYHSPVFTAFLEDETFRASLDSEEVYDSYLERMPQYGLYYLTTEGNDDFFTEEEWAELAPRMLENYGHIEKVLPVLAKHPLHYEPLVRWFVYYRLNKRSSLIIEVLEKVPIVGPYTNVLLLLADANNAKLAILLMKKGIYGQSVADVKELLGSLSKPRAMDLLKEESVKSLLGVEGVKEWKKKVASRAVAKKK